MDERDNIFKKEEKSRKREWLRAMKNVKEKDTKREREK